MKPLALPLIAVTLLFSIAHADSFEIIRDGRVYLCTSDEIPDSNGSIDCTDEAYRGPFTLVESKEICEGANTKGPALCAIKAYAGPFARRESIDLCKGAKTQGPADCAIALYNGPFSKSESLGFCTKSSTKAHADCALKAYAGPYSKAEALRLCKADPMLVMRALNVIAKSKDAQSEVRKFKNQLKPALD